MGYQRKLNLLQLGVIGYSVALELQYRLVAARMQEVIGDTLILLEHPHVYTLGRGADEKFLIDPPEEIPIHRVSRGGQVTYHGPGQLVAYPIIRLEGPDRDVLLYLRRLERVIIETLAALGIEAGRRGGLTGVWVGTEKIASVGVGIRRWTTSHGFAINVAPELGYFERIVPCGIDGCRMTSIANLGRGDIGIAQVEAETIRQFAAVFNYTEVVAASSAAIGQEFANGAFAIDAD
jgi:lipoate-protein ligase B